MCSFILLSASLKEEYRYSIGIIDVIEVFNMSDMLKKHNGVFDVSSSLISHVLLKTIQFTAQMFAD